MERLLQDIRYGIRVLIKSRGFTAAAVLALALGIGANTAVFSVVNAVLLSPLPYTEPDRLVRISETSPQFDEMSVSYLNFYDWRRQSQSFDAMAAYRSDAFNISGAGGAERVWGRYVSAGFFTLLGVLPAQGRDLSAEDDRPGSGPTAIISHELWQRRFGSDPKLIGRPIDLDGKGFTVVGILPPGFRFYSYADVFIPFNQTEEMLLTERDMRAGTRVIGRLKPGVTIEQARAEMEGLAAALAGEYPEANAEHGANLALMHEDLVGEMRKPFTVLLIAVAFVLLIACANVANLLLARASARQKEIAIRVALGAGRWRIVRQLLSESLLLALAGGALGLLLAYWGVDLLAATLADALPRAERIGIDGAVLAFTLTVTVLTGLIFGLAPALSASKPDLHEAIKEGGRTSAGAGQSVRGGLVVFEVAITLVLLIGAGLMIRTILAIYDIHPGFDPNNVVTMQVTLSNHSYSEPSKIRAFYRRLLERVKALPGVEAASVTTDMPLEDDSEAPFFVEGQPPATQEQMPWALFYAVGPGYLKTMGMPLIKGRFITDQDTENSRRVMVIDENLADGLFPGQDPLGKRLVIPMAGDPWEIVGVVEHVKHMGLVEDAHSKIRYQFYMPFLQIPDQFMGLAGTNISLLVRTNLDAPVIAEQIKTQMLDVDKDQPIFGARSMNEVVARSISQRRLLMTLLAVFASVALALAAVGIYGVMSYAVAQRTHEIGIRMALGASVADVLRLVVGRGMALALAGVALGLVGTYIVGQVLSSWLAGLLFGVEATDLATFIIISAILVLVALGACYVPARRATKVDPMVALRYE
jgi:putative ABC transport system permease protein